MYVFKAQGLHDNDINYFNIDVDLPGVAPPNEDLPDGPPIDQDDYDAADEEYNPNSLDAEEEVFVHFLSPDDLSIREPRRDREDYTHRLQAEKEAWSAQSRLLANAFIEWESAGPKFLSEGSSFKCKIISIFCESFDMN